jgi:hypothetical protein
MDSRSPANFKDKGPKITHAGRSTRKRTPGWKVGTGDISQMPRFLWVFFFLKELKIKLGLRSNHFGA